MKITIVTIYDPLPNYGNRLQNYAVQSIFDNLGYETVTISYAKSVLPLKSKLKAYLMRLTSYQFTKNESYWKSFPYKVSAFDKFNREYIHTQHIKKIDQIKDSDYYVVGSDQVWNPSWYGKDDIKKDLFLLTFADQSKKVCISPSFGIDALPNEWKSWFAKHLVEFPHLAVREKSGAKIIKELTGQEAIVTIDPTLMLDRETWNKISRCPKNIVLETPYILTYFLGGRSEKINNDLQVFSQENNFAIYNLLDTLQPELYRAGPSEFLYLIDHANLIMTDSFHACVFSFLFGKPFLVYSREGKQNKMMSRIDTLLETFCLERKYVDSGIPNNLLECDYQKGYEVLTQERHKVMNYLKATMNIQ